MEEEGGGGWDGPKDEGGWVDVGVDVEEEVDWEMT